MKYSIFLVLVGHTFSQWFDVDPFANSAFEDSGKVGPIRYSFTTSQITTYLESKAVPMQVRIDLFGSFFMISNDCSAVWAGTGGLPALAYCIFSDTSATLHFALPLSPEVQYSLTILTQLPPVILPDTYGNTNAFTLSVSFENGTLVEKSSSLIELTRRVQLNAGTYDLADAASLTGFELIAQSNQGMAATSVEMVFSLSWSGTFDRRYVFEFHALPSNVWNLGVVGSNCPGYESMRLIPGSSCVLVYFPDLSTAPSNANGFQILIGETNAVSVSPSVFSSFHLLVNNPSIATNLPWIAVTRRVNGLDKGRFCSSQILTSSVVVQSVPTGSVTRLSATSLQVRFVPHIGLSSATVRIQPPAGGFVIDTSRLPTASLATPILAPSAWQADTAGWTLTLAQTPLLQDTEYSIVVFVLNITQAFFPPLSWIISLTNTVEGESFVLGFSQTIRGVSVPVLMTNFSVLPTTALIGAVSVEIGFQFILDRVNAPRIIVTAPFGFAFPPVCGDLVQGCSCLVSSNLGGFEIDCPKPNGTPTPALVTVFTLVDYPTTWLLGGQWELSSQAWDGSVVRMATLDAFPLFPNALSAFAILPSSRMAGVEIVNFIFVLSSDLLKGGTVVVRSPLEWVSLSSVWQSASIQFSEDWMSVNIVTGERLLAGVRYGLSGSVVIPPVTASPNRWWIEVNTKNGQRDSSLSQPGFPTQTLNPISVTPYDQVISSYQNLVAFRFTPTSNATSGIRVTAPTGFVFLCLPTILFPFQSSHERILNAVSNCSASSNSVTISNQTVSANVRYLLVLPVANSASTGTPNDVFTVATIGVESGSTASFPLVPSLTNSQYLPQPGQEDRRAGFLSSITFGWSLPTLPPNATIVLTAPLGFAICAQVGQSCLVSPAPNLGSRYTLLPTGVFVCSCPNDVGIANITVSGLAAGTYGALVNGVSNPIRTPAWNYWQLAVSVGGVLVGQAPWMLGYAIQEISNVSIVSLNPSVDDTLGRAFLRPIEFVFNTSTLISASAQLPAMISIRAPVGFWTDLTTGSPCLVQPIDSGSPSFVSCAPSPDDAQLVWISVLGILPPGRYGYRVSIFRNPSTSNTSFAGWNITSYLSGGSVADIGQNIASFALTRRLPFFDVIPNSFEGTATTSARFQFILAQPLLPGDSLGIWGPLQFGNVGQNCTISVTTFIVCVVVSTGAIQLYNNEPVRTGRWIAANVVYEQLVDVLENPAVSPSWNYWKIATSTGETWGMSGYAIAPQFAAVSIMSSNPAFGLFTEFAFSLTTVSALLPGGNIVIQSPAQLIDFYPTWSVCPFNFVPCDVPLCAMYLAMCVSGTLGSIVRNLDGSSVGPIMTTSSDGESFKLLFGATVAVAANTTLNFTVSGFNSLSTNGMWNLSSWNTESGSTPLDSKTITNPFTLFDPIVVYSLTCSQPTVSAAANQVELTFQIPHSVADIDIYFPASFNQNGASVTLGAAFATSTTWNFFSPNRVRVTSSALIPSIVVLSLSLILANPAIGPSVNFWSIESANGINRKVPGFDIFGAFSSVNIVGRVSGPNQINTIGISFVLSSDLTWNNSTIALAFPSGFALVDSQCGLGLFSTEYTRYEGADTQFAPGSVFIGLPSASVCSIDSGVATIVLDGPLSAGIAYAFQIGLVNPPHTPDVNFWQIATSVNGVVLHRNLTLPGLTVDEINSVLIQASNPSRGAVDNQVTVSIESNKTISGGALIQIIVPLTFTITCRGIGWSGLGSTTACTVVGSTIQLQLDPSDLIDAMTNWWVKILVTNPETTPWVNLWAVEILTSDLVAIDVKTDVFAFDITGAISGSVVGKFVYVNQQSLVVVTFSPSSTQARVRLDNEIVITAPDGFKASCQSFTLVELESSPYSLAMGSSACVAFANNTLLVQFSPGFGLHAGSNYTMEFQVVNAQYMNASTTWSIATRTDAHVLDFNASLPGYQLASFR